jgi:diguanylate cyclase (GGDEF)-like protein
MVFARLGGEQGLSHGEVTSIMQDGSGFLWFGTEDGLDRFDGYELRHFIHARADAGTLPNNWVSSLARDAAGRLWIGSDGGGVVWRNDESSRFQAADTLAGALKTDREAKVRALHVDRQGRLWVAARDGGVELIDFNGARVTRFRHHSDDPASLSDDSVYAIAEDGSGRIWIGTATGLDLVNPVARRIERLGPRLQAAGAPQNAAIKVNTLFADAHGNVWVGMDFGLARVNLASGAYTLLRHDDRQSNTLPNGRVTALLEDRDGRLWVGTSAGLALLNRGTDSFWTVRHDPANPSSLPDSYVTSLYEDSGGLLWIGTKSGGAARWNPRSWSFGHHRFGEEGADGVTAFAVDRKSMLWVGSFGAGAASIDPATGAIHRYRTGTSALALHDDTVMAIVTDDQDRVWFGTMSHGIERLDPALREIKNFTYSTGDPKSLPAAGVMSLLRDTRGRIWVGTYGGGLARIDPDSDAVVRYEHGHADQKGLAGDRATALAEGGDGLIWIGTDGSGLDVLDPATGRFAHFVHDAGNPNSLSANAVFAVHVDERGTVWVGTRGGGLDRVVGAPFARSPPRFENLSENDGLPNSTVYGIESDAGGRLWVSTNVGLAAIDPAAKSIRGFRRSHGLQGDEFNFGAHYRAPDGTLYFGGSNGYNAFQPEHLLLNDRPPHVVITDISVLNKRVTPTPERLRKLDLGFRDAIVTFEFAALDFTDPAANRYAYRLEGFDRDWVTAGTGRRATYTNLDGGNYVFRVRAANNDGLWNETPVSIQLHVAPQPWATWWARGAYAAILFAVVYLVWLAQHKRVVREAAYAKRLEREVESRTLELAERNRDMEFANEQLRSASVTDSLTGLGNRRCLHDAMVELFAAAAAAPVAADRFAPAVKFVLMVVDLDNLKPINDQYGHEGGDAALLQITEILRREFRPNDLIVRWGGDEFVVVCRDTDLEMACAIAERVRLAVAKRIFRLGEGRTARTSCSIGFAPVPFIPGHADMIDWEQSLSIADMALYEAKRTRNTWVGWSGTAKAAELPSLAAMLVANAAELESGGYLVVRRRAFDSADTVDHLRALPHAAAP